MKKKQIRFILFLTPLLLCGCMSFGRKFSYESVSRLKLGELKSSECRVMYGAPYRVGTEKNKDGSFEKLVYHFSHSNFFDVLSYRTLSLEFKDGILNAYDYLSTFNQDRTKVSFNEIEKIKIAQSTKSDVLNILGEPTGKALCPTTLYSIKDECESDGEIWVWRADHKFSIYSSPEERKAEIHIIFGKDSVVSNIATLTSPSRE